MCKNYTGENEEIQDPKIMAKVILNISLEIKRPPKEVLRRICAIPEVRRHIGVEKFKHIPTSTEGESGKPNYLFRLKTALKKIHRPNVPEHGQKWSKHEWDILIETASRYARQNQTFHGRGWPTKMKEEIAKV